MNIIGLCIKKAVWTLDSPESGSISPTSVSWFYPQDAFLGDDEMAVAGVSCMSSDQAI